MGQNEALREEALAKIKDGAKEGLPTVGQALANASIMAGMQPMREMNYQELSEAEKLRRGITRHPDNPGFAPLGYAILLKKERIDKTRGGLPLPDESLEAWQFRAIAVGPHVNRRINVGDVITLSPAGRTYNDGTSVEVKASPVIGFQGLYWIVDDLVVAVDLTRVIEENNAFVSDAQKQADANNLGDPAVTDEKAVPSDMSER